MDNKRSVFSSSFDGSEESIVPWRRGNTKFSCQLSTHNWVDTWESCHVQVKCLPWEEGVVSGKACPSKSAGVVGLLAVVLNPIQVNILHLEIPGQSVGSKVSPGIATLSRQKEKL